MATTEPFYVGYRTQTVFTYRQAINYIKLRNSFPTRNNISWRSLKTGKTVVIGCVDF